jgi:hypothetical protein
VIPKIVQVVHRVGRIAEEAVDRRLPKAKIKP